MFHPGETVTHSFDIPYHKEDINTVIVSYRQFERLVLEKIITSKAHMVTMEDGMTEIIVDIREEESLLFTDETQCSIQLNVLFEDGSRTACDELFENVGVQHIQDIGDEAKQKGFGTLMIDDDGYLVYTHNPGEETFAIDNDGFLVIEREVV